MTRVWPNIMRTRTSFRLACIGTVAMLLGTVPLFGQEAQAQGSTKSLEEAIGSLGLGPDEEVIDAELRTEGERKSYLVTVLGKDGQVRKVPVDAGG